MYTLQSIAHNARSFANINWRTETLPLPLAKATKVLRQRQANSTGKFRYRLHKV